MTDTRLAFQSAEVVTTGTPNVVLETVVLEALTQGTPSVVLETVIIEVLTPTTPLKGVWGTRI